MHWYVSINKGYIQNEHELNTIHIHIPFVLFSQRTPVVYEIEEILKKYQIEYSIWHDKVKKNVQMVLDNYKVKLSTPSLPVFAWKPMLFVIGTIGIFYMWKYINTI